MAEVKNRNVVLYTTHCPMCRQLARQLGLNDIQYKECSDLDKMKELGFTHLPILEVDGEQMDFASAIKWIREQE